ncbi:hypothetical protein Pmani_004184 [Petrolisthes manimaculis]|uniref:RBR-type E3 ubiquitin transferase n=1 Tax=Petrolisthes manimaculis TaxID=1843537 RepID=A0AAE1QFE8_9EUCA|nr:hypothetical protein Pmani_004184 [Petrolisthes manimaculis]
MLKNGLEGKDLTSKKINEMKGFSGNLRNIWVWIGAKHNITNAIEDITEEESTFFSGVLNTLSEGMFDNLRHEIEDSPNVIYNICHKCLQLKLVPENQVALPAACGAPQQPIPADVIRFVCEDCSSKMVMKTEMSVDACYPDNTIEAALYTRQRASISTDTGGPDSECVSSKEVIRQCPVCKHDIVKEGGCLVMNCPVQSCRGEFCFICGLQRDDDEPGSVYTHLSRIHNVNYFGDLSEQQDLPILKQELVQIASGSQYLYVFDIDKYYFDTVTLKLEKR